MLSSTAVSRLTKLAKVASEFPREHFGMRASYISDTAPGPGTVITRRNITGTATACALGIAGTIPEFREKGLKVVVSDRINGRGFASFRGHGGFDEFTAAAFFFDISLEQAHNLFSSGRMPVSTPKLWAKACARFIKSGGARAI